MWEPTQHLPPFFSNATITESLTSIGLPKPLQIRPFSTTAAYHSVYMLSLPHDSLGVDENHRSDGQALELVLRVSGHHFPGIKTINEAAVISWMEAHTSIPVPKVVHMSSSCENVLKHEYTLQRRLPGGCLDQVFRSVTPDQMDKILDQVIDLLATLHSKPWLHIGGLKFAENGDVVPGPVLEEIAWQVPEIQKYWGSQTFQSLNISGPYPDYVSYISAHTVKYIHAISNHPSLTWLQYLIPRLRDYLRAISRDKMELNKIKICLSHNDLHFSNIMIDPSTAKITGILDWEFAQVVPYTRWDPMTHFLANQGIKEATARKADQMRLCQRFEERCKVKGTEYLVDDAKYTSKKQKSMQLTVNFLGLIVKACLKDEEVEMVQEWRAELEKQLETCLFEPSSC